MATPRWFLGQYPTLEVAHGKRRSPQTGVPPWHSCFSTEKPRPQPGLFVRKARAPAAIFPKPVPVAAGTDKVDQLSAPRFFPDRPPD
jgi:hypothetical protein